MPGVHTTQFDELSTCIECVAAGYGWSIRKQQCGGYKNKRCDVSVSMPAAATEASPPVSGPWMLGSFEQESPTGSTNSLPVAPALVLSLVLAVTLAWSLKSTHQKATSKRGDDAMHGNSVEQNVEPKAASTERSNVVRRKRRSRRASQVVQYPTTPCGILKEGLKTHQDPTRQIQGKNLPGPSFAPTPEIRLFKRWQKPPMATSKHNSPRKAASILQGQFELDDLTKTFRSLATQDQQADSDSTANTGLSQTESDPPDESGAPSSATAPPNLSYIFAAP